MNARAAPALIGGSSKHRKLMIAKIHIAQDQLGLVEDDYRAVISRVAGRRSAKDCTDSELVDVLKEFERLGFSAKPKAAPIGGNRPADHPSARKARALWISLYQLGAVRNRSEEALEAFACAQLKCARLQWANQSHAYKLIEALKDMARRAGWNQDLTGVRPDAAVLVLKRRLVDALLDKMAGAMLVPVDWDVAVAAYRLGGVTLDGGPLSWTLTELDVVAKLFGDKLREATA